MQDYIIRGTAVSVLLRQQQEKPYSMQEKCTILLQ